jgi:ferrous-iron efflux pump FieF
MPLSHKEKLVKKATYISLGAAILTFFIRFYLMLATASMSVAASLVDSMLDFVTAGINLFAVHYSQQPPDKQHRFGHGKAEDIAVFAQGLFFGLSGIYIIYLALHEFITQKPVETKTTDIILMFGSIIINLAVIYYQKLVIKKPIQM